jgi:uncharacterized protein (DUF1800 family)
VLAGLIAAATALHPAEYDQRLLSLSSRGMVGTGAGIMICGFSINAGAPKTVLIRAVGPQLAAYGVTGVLANPTLTIFDRNGAVVQSNDNWSDAGADIAALRNAFAAVYAFDLATGSNDAALLVTLPPGIYTAEVSGVGATQGIALLEVYDLSGSGRLVSLSTRAQVGTGDGILISGLSVSATSGPRHLLVRAIGPTLANYDVPGVLADPAFAIVDSKGTQIAANDNWGTPDTGGALAQAFAQSGAFPLPAGSKDAALLVDLPSGLYSIMVHGVGGTQGIALVEVYDLTPESLALVNVAATVATTDNVGAAPGIFTFTRSGDLTQPLAISYTIGGTANAALDFQRLPGTATFPAGVGSLNVNVAPYSGTNTTLGSHTVTVTLTDQPSYGVGANYTATVTISYTPGTLYVANLRPVAGAAGTSTASGTATIQLSPDKSFALVNLAFSNLSSSEVVAHLALGAPGQNSPFVQGLPYGQVNAFRWTFSPVGTFSSADLVQALLNGQIYLELDSASFPNGELEGQFILSSGSQAFAPPASPPALADQALAAGDAARFLVQATFGPTKAEVDALTGKRLADLNNWIIAQMALPATLHRTATMADFAANNSAGQGGSNGGTNPYPGGGNRQAAWWKNVVTGPDELRQRVAFALSEIFVISDVNSTVNAWQEGAANYYDILVNDAFGNYRQLIEDVTLSPMMGNYLSSLRNRKATYSAQGVLLTSPDENYAREIMQLLTIGLNQLQPDGTLKLDPGGLPIPTYDQTTIVETAKVFTGWSYHTATPATTSFTGGPADYINPMTFFAAYHEIGAKTIVTGKVLPANQGGVQDLKDELDTLFNHPNTGPFISRQLIQRLVTSNPSPGYIYRVAQVFANNGSGVRGDLGAVVRAILTDYEARSPAVVSDAGYGKLKEPLLRTTALLRAFNGGSDSGRFNIANPEVSLDQAALRAQTVFNFFAPDFVLSGTLAAAGLYAPEFEIHTDTTAISVPNFLYAYLYATRSATAIGLDLSNVLPLAKQPGPLVDYLNTVFCAGALPSALHDRIVTAINALPTSTTDTERVRSAIYLVVTSPFAAVQK